MSVYFNGQLLISPTSASAVDDSAMRNQNLSVGNAVAIVGLSEGGSPKTALSFGSPQEAQSTLVGGELLEAVLVAKFLEFSTLCSILLDHFLSL